MKFFCCAILSISALTPIAHAQVDNFPHKPITIVVPFTPGSSADTASRFFSIQLAKILGQPFVIDNRAGGAGVLAMTMVRNAPADGYTLFLASNSLMSVNPLVNKALPYEPAKYLKPIGGMTRGVNMLVVSGSSKYRTLGELVESGKKETQGLNGGTYSAGYRLAAEWLAALAGFKLTNIGYKGVTQLLTDVVSNQLDFAVVSLDGAAPLVKSGQLRAIAISDDKRHADFPNVPTIKESYPTYVNYSWDSLYVRMETPKDIADKLSSALQQVLATLQSKEFVARSGRQMMAFTPEEMKEYQAKELARFKTIADAAGIKPE